MHYSIDEAGVWVDCVRARKPVIHNDYKSLPHKKGMPAGHAEVVRELVVPILREDRVVAILGVGNKSVDYTEKDGEIVAYLADVAWEITIRKRAEESLRVEKENLNAIMAASTVGMMVFDGKEEIVYANSTAERMFQTPLDALSAKKCGELIGCANRCENDEGCGYSSQCPDCAFLKAIRQVLTDGQGVFYQEAAVVRETAEGRKQDWYDFSVESVMLGGNRHAILALTDISLRKQWEEEIRKNESRFRQLYENSPVAYQ
jgi:two-component system sensor histidine kinase/response regulator